EDHPSHDRLGAHHPAAAELLGLRQRRLYVGDFDVEGDVALVAVGPLADPAAEADAFAVAVGFAVDEAVSHLVVGVDVPVEELSVVALQPAAVAADHLEVHDWLSHHSPFLVRCAYPSRCGAATAGQGSGVCWWKASSHSPPCSRT